MQAFRRNHRTIFWIVAGVALVACAALVLHVLDNHDMFGTVTDAAGNYAYLAVFLLVFGDAICPIFPGETTLNTASALAANGDLQLGLVMLAGALGAVVGDSALYWIARGSRKRVEPQLEKAKQNEKIGAALEFMGTSAPLLIVLGRYVPGLRFVVNATMGLQQYPYRKFLLWSAIGGVLWSVYTCGLAYAVATALEDFPLASVIISGLITTAAIAAIFIVLRRRRHQSGAVAEAT